MSSEVNHKERKHSLLSPSAAERWMNCTPSAVLGERFEDKSSVAAREGTLAHEFAEWSIRQLTGGCSIAERRTATRKLKKHELFAPDMEPAVKVYRGYVKERINANKVSDVYIEESFDISRFVPDCEGLADLVLVSDNHIEVIDYKHGKGIRVDAVGNKQLRLYALGALEALSLLYDIKVVTMTVVQPRLDHIDSESLEVETLYKWADEEVAPKAALAFDGLGECNTGDWCRWCKAKPVCKAIHTEIKEIASKKFNDPKLLDHKDLAEIYDLLKRAEDTVKSIRSYMLKEALKGETFEGLKLVEGKSNRVITNTIEAQKVLAEMHDPKDYLNVKLKGIGDLEKLLTKDVFDDSLGHLVDKPKGKPILVKDSDKRPVYNSAAADFSVIK